MARRKGPLMLEAETVEWGTPPEIVQRYASLWAGGAFDLDVAASDNLHVCAHYFTFADDGLERTWRGKCWMNPPYGYDEERWIAKAVHEVNAGHAELVVGLLPAKTGKKWWRELIQYERRGSEGFAPLRPPVTAVDFLPGRVAYLRPDGSRGSVAGFSSVAILFGGKR